MNFEEQHVVWKQQVQKLIESNQELQETGTTNILRHFFSQVIARDFCHELDTTRQQIQKVVAMAIEKAPYLHGDVRTRATAVFSAFQQLEEQVLPNIRLNDIRNILVFEVYKRCGVTVDTYFERYSSPPGTEVQSQSYLDIAHGKAICTAIWAEKLSFIINTVALLKSVFFVYDIFVGNVSVASADSSTLNWHGAKWSVIIQQRGLGDLVWNTFLDVWDYEHSLYK